MLRIILDVNGERIGTLVCTRQKGGPADGWNRYKCHCTNAAGTFEVRHNRPDGAWSLAAAATTVLAEAGVGAWDAETV